MDTCLDTKTNVVNIESRENKLPKGGVEPPLSCENRILSPARLPIPPLRLMGFDKIPDCFLINITNLKYPESYMVADASILTKSIHRL